jgi:hypothetical protein
MPALAIFSLVTCVAVLMLIVSIRALVWHRISRFLQTLLLLLILFANWLVISSTGLLSFEWGLLFALCALVGLLVGFIRGQAAPMRYDPQIGDVVCKRRGFLIFCWAAIAVIYVTLLNGPGPHDPAWRIGLPAALTFLTASFAATTLTIFSRLSGMQEDHRMQSQQHEIQTQ